MRDSAEMLKEQLRNQGKEMQRREAEQAKNEAKIKHILKISQEKIEDLQHEVKSKEHEIEQARNFSKGQMDAAEKENNAASSEGESDATDSENENKKIKELQKKLEEAAKEKEKLVQEIKKGAKATSDVKTKEVKDPKLVKALKKLKLANEDLKKKIKPLSTKIKTHEKEKVKLAEEIKRLRENPEPSGSDSTGEVKKKVLDQELKHQESIESYQKLIDEKEEMIQSLQKIMDDSRQAGDSDKEPSEIIKDLKDSLEDLEKEKADLDKELSEHKKDFKKKLEKQIKELEEEWQEKLDKAKKPEKKKDDHVCEEGAPLWMATFSDMVTLVMVFFILMYAIASKNVQTFKSAIIGAEAKSIGVLEALNAVEVQERLENLEMTKSDDIMSEISGMAEEADLDVDTSKSKVIVRVPGASLFKPAQATLQLSARPVLDAVINTVNKYPDYKIHVQGHTDDDPISTAMFPTNWELSAARATAVLRYFIDKGADPERMTATGYADIFPLVSNETPYGRAKNRRVEFVLEKEK
uniref:Flagellar motor protein n=1 Tax=uncultured Desulfobacterales bacterium HF0200_07G10 TaxID=710741 RepID=E0XU16_9BACT|nr:flagellar motor protein [uncultured Desulfobacterales bacterium HF0200_07G10]